MALAFLIVGIAIVPALSLFFGTSRLQNKSTGVFREAVAAQMLWEVLKYRAAIDPGWLKNQPPVQLGAFVTADGPRDPSGQPIPLSPLVEYLFNRSGGALYQAPNQDSLSGIQSLAHNFQDLGFRITIADGSVPAWKPADPVPGPGVRENTEQVKDVAVEVFRVGSDRRIREPAAFRVDSELITPAASLSLTAVLDLETTQDGYSYAHDLKQAYGTMAPVTEAAGLPPAAAIAATNLALVAVESVGESILTIGHDLGFAVPDGDTGRGSHYQLEQLELLGLNGKFANWMRADLHVEEARGIALAWRRSIVPLHQLELYMDDLSSRLGRIADSLKNYKDSHLGAERALDPSGELGQVTEGLFWREMFLQQTKWLAALARPEVYPDRYRVSFERACAAYALVEADPQAWPMERVWSLNAYLDVEKARKLFLEANTLPEDALIATRATEYQAMHRPYADALASDDYRSLTTLQQRNPTFAFVLGSLAHTQAQDSDYQKLMRLIRPDGGLIQMLAGIQANTTSPLNDTVAQLDTTLSNLVRLARSNLILPDGQIPPVELPPALIGPP